MPRDERVVDALVGLRKAGEPAVLPQRRELLHAPGQRLVGVALMPDVEHETIPRRVKDAVDRHRQLHRAEVRRQVTAGLGDAFQQKRMQFFAQSLRLRPVEGFDVRRRVNML